MQSEDALLNSIACESMLSKLTGADREMMLLIFEFALPPDYSGPVPVTYAAIGVHIGEKYEGKPLSEAAIRYRRDVVLAVLRGERGPLRRGESPEHP